jgi:hypothetical protein
MSDDVHDDAVLRSHPEENPQEQGPNLSLEVPQPAGAIRDRQVLVYAGNPSDIDDADRDAIEANLDPDPYTTVITVGGYGSIDGYDYPASRGGFREALSEIAAAMDSYTQFIFFVTGQGGMSVTNYYIDCDGNDCISENLAFPGSVWHYMQEIPDNQPQLLLVSPVLYPQPITVVVGTHYYDDIYFDYQYNPNEKRSIQGYVALIEVQESHLDSGGVVVAAYGETPLTIPLATIESPAITNYQGDCDPNGNGAIAIDDVVDLVDFIFNDGDSPTGRCHCDGDLELNIADAASIFAFLYRDGVTPGPQLE